MATAEIGFHPAAQDEYHAAYLWYAERSADVADRFEAEVERGLELIAEAPAALAALR